MRRGRVCVPPAHQPELDFRKAEFRVLARDDHIADQRELQTATEREAFHRADKRFRKVRQFTEQLVHFPRAAAEAIEIEILVVLDLELAGVDAGAERFFGSVNDGSRAIRIKLRFPPERIRLKISSQSSRGWSSTSRAD